MAGGKSTVIAAGVIFGVLPIIFVGLRFLARRLMHQRPGIDDWLAVAALIFTVALAATMITSAEIGGLGEDQLLDPEGNLFHYTGLYNYEKCKYVIQICSIVSVGLAKLSVLYLYRRIFATPRYRQISTACIVFVTAWTIAFFFATVFQCTPVDSIWTRFEIEYPQYCVDVVPYYYALSITDTIIDFGLLVTPLPMIYTLHMPWKQKIGLFASFVLGGSVVAVTIVRFVVFIRVGRGMMENYKNITSWTMPVMLWSLIESSLSLIATSVPTLRPILSRSKRLSRPRSGTITERQSGIRESWLFGDGFGDSAGRPLGRSSGGTSEEDIRPTFETEVSSDGTCEEGKEKGIWVQKEISTSFS